jgi:cell division protein FtsL
VKKLTDIFSQLSATRTRWGLGVNLFLLVLVLASGLMLVRWQYESRNLQAQLERANKLGRHLANEQAGALSQKRQLSAHARAEQAAVQKLKMQPADPAVTHYLGRQP